MNNLQWIEVAVVGIGCLLFFLYKLFDYKRDKTKIVDDFNRNIFTNTIKSLCSPNNREQISSAIMLRRFLNKSKKNGINKLSYKQEALNIIVSLLRIEKYGEFQKTLADSFSYVDSMPNQDMQYTNLQNAYIKPSQSSASIKANFSHVDFFMSDLSHASLNNLDLQAAVFCQANLFKTTFRDCDLTGANFSNSDLLYCKFKGDCIFTGANFSNAKNIPAEILNHLDSKGIWHDEVAANNEYTPSHLQKKVFISCLGNLTLPQGQYLETLTQMLRNKGVDSIRYSRDNYRKSGQIGLIRNEMMLCDGVIIIGFKSITVNQGLYRPNSSDAKELKDINISTPWSGIEAGMACALGLPVLVLSDDNLADGIFDPEISDKCITRSVLNNTSLQDVGKWVNTL